VHCAAAGLRDSPPAPIFGDDTITLQPVTRVSLPLSAGLLGLVEASDRSTAEKNLLCRPNPWPQTPFDFVRHLITGLRIEMAWAEADDVNAWVNASRLNLIRDLDSDPDKAAVAELQGRFLNAVFPALAKLDELATHATPAEQRRLTPFE
jgi:hypothetical protein